MSNETMYRSLPEQGPACDAHPSAPARGRCADCDAHVCTPCSLYVELRLVCPRCAKRAWRRDLVSRYGARAAIAASLLAIAVGATVMRVRHHRDPYNWGAHASAIHRLQARIEAQPCDAPALLALADELQAAYDPWSASFTLERASTVCKLPVAVPQRQLELASALHDWSGATRYATQLITLEPERADHYYRRGYAEQMSGEPARAVEDFAEALRRDPLHGDALDRMVFIYETVGRGDVARTIKSWARFRQQHLVAPGAAQASDPPLPPIPSFEEPGRFL